MENDKNKKLTAADSFSLAAYFLPILNVILAFFCKEPFPYGQGSTFKIFMIIHALLMWFAILGSRVSWWFVIASVVLGSLTVAAPFFTHPFNIIVAVKAVCVVLALIGSVIDLIENKRKEKQN